MAFLYVVARLGIEPLKKELAEGSVAAESNGLPAMVKTDINPAPYKLVERGGLQGNIELKHSRKHLLAALFKGIHDNFTATSPA